MKKSLFLILLFLMYQVIAGVLAQVWSHLSNGGADMHVAQAMNMPSATVLGVSMLVSMALVLCLFFALKLVRRNPWQTIAQAETQTAGEGQERHLATLLFPKKKWEAKAIKGRPVNAAGWGMAVAGFVVLSLGLNFLMSSFDLNDHGLQKLFEGMKDSVPCLFLLSVAGPVFEELVFREGVLRQLVYSRRKSAPQTGGMNLLWATITSALCFGIIHGNLPQGIAAFMLGLALGLCYCHTGNIVLCSVLHVVNNSMAVALMFLPGVNNMLENQSAAVSWAVGLPCVAIGAVLLVWMYLSDYFTKKNK